MNYFDEILYLLLQIHIILKLLIYKIIRYLIEIIILRVVIMKIVFFENDINGLFKKDTLLKIIKNYVHYSKKDSKNIKFFPRYHQFVCCEKCFLQLQQENKKKCGFV